VLVASNQARRPELVPVRNGRMLKSPFTFYRGLPLMMAGDLSHTPTTGIDVQICGDAHLLNFGAFAAPERNMVFDVNDFDETQLGPWEDLKRLAGRGNFRDRGTCSGVVQYDRTAARHYLNERRTTRPNARRTRCQTQAESARTGGRRCPKTTACPARPRRPRPPARRRLSVASRHDCFFPRRRPSARWLKAAQKNVAAAAMDPSRTDLRCSGRPESDTG
jgi:hypothetical protein